LESVFATIYSNHACVNFEKQRIEVTPYHAQNFCALCPRNLCKGDVLMEHLRTRRENGLRTLRIIYVGDGANDFCPCTKLGSNDVVFCRKSFELEKLLRSELGKTDCRLFADVRFYSHACYVREALRWPKRPRSSVMNSVPINRSHHSSLSHQQLTSNVNRPVDRLSQDVNGDEETGFKE
jgi:hypothetical protein